MLSLWRVGFLNKRGEGGTRADLKCEVNEASVSNKLIIGVIGVLKMSIQTLSRLVGIGSKSNYLHGARRTRRHTSSAITHKLDYVRSSWYQEDLTHMSMSQTGRKIE